MGTENITRKKSCMRQAHETHVSQTCRSHTNGSHMLVRHRSYEPVSGDTFSIRRGTKNNQSNN